MKYIKKENIEVTTVKWTGNNKKSINKILIDSGLNFSWVYAHNEDLLYGPSGYITAGSSITFSVEYGIILSIDGGI